MDVFDSFKELCSFFVLAKSCKDEHQILNCVGIFLVLGLDVSHQVRALAVLA